VKRDVRAAYHESGHAVVMTLLNLPFSYVTIDKSSDGSGGHLKFYDHTECCSADAELRVLVSGYVATQLVSQVTARTCNDFWRRWYGFHLTGDGQRALRSLRECGITDKAADERIIYEATHVRWVFENHKYIWDGVEALVKELLVRRTVPGDEARHIICRATGVRWRGPDKQTVEV
jgi:hypothetical protein